MPDIRVNDLPVLAAPTDADVLHAIDDADDKDKQLTVGALKAFAQTGTATAAQGAKADTALQPGSVNLGTTATTSTRTVTNTAGAAAVLPTFDTNAGLVPGTASGTTNFLRADGTWTAPPSGTGTVTNVSGTAPIAVATGTTTPVVSIAAATTGAAGSMSGADKTKLDGVAPGATANSTDAQLRDRSTHTGTQLAATISDFTASSRAQVEATLTAGSNITLTPSGSGATRTIAIASTAAGGGGGTVTQVDGGAGLTGSVTTTGALAVGAGTGISVAADAVAVDRTVVDTWYATAAQGTLAGTAVQSVVGTAPITATGTTTRTVGIDAATTSAAGSMSSTDKTKLDGIATGATANSTDAQLRDRSTHTGTQLAATISDFTASSRAQTEAMLTAGTNVTLTPSGSGATRSIQISATAGGGGVSTVTGTAPIVSSGGGSPAISITPASGSAAGSMSSADFTKLAGVAAGATANSPDATLLARANHTGTQLAATISDFTASSRAQVEATLVAGTNVTLTPAGSGATRTITIAATAGGGGVSTVNSRTGAVVLTAGDVSDVGNPSTGYFLAPSGTTAQRPGTPLPGMLRWNTSTSRSEFYTGSAWVNHARLAGDTFTGAVSITDATASINTTTGAFVVTGGVGIGGNLNAANFSGSSSGTNTGDNAPNSLYSGLVSNATHTGDATGATALTLATVNSNVGAFGSATQVATFTVNAKGLTTAAANVTVTPAIGSVTGLGTGVAAFLATPNSANLATAVTNETGSGSLVFATSPTLVTPVLGTPTSGTLTSCTGLPIATGISGLGTGVATALAVNTGAAGAFGVVVAKGTAALGTAAIASGANATTVTVAAAGVATTDVIDWGFNTNPNAVTGYNAALTIGCLVITCFPTAGNINFVVSNPTAASITPGALTLNWTVTR